MQNTIILVKGYARLNSSEHKDFRPGDTIWEEGSNPEEIERWSITDEDAAIEALAGYRCRYAQGQPWEIEEYALEYCECDDNGDFVSGSDYRLAEIG